MEFMCKLASSLVVEAKFLSLSKKGTIQTGRGPTTCATNIIEMGTEEAKTVWPTFHQRMQKFKAHIQSPPTLADLALRLSNLGRQRFNKLDASNTWKQKLDTKLSNKLFVI
eukprot:1021410-Pelagomonas_calceolata.AAC.2